MKKIIIIYLIVLIFISSSITGCNKPRETYIQTYRFGKELITIKECINMGIVTKNMTMEECNQAVKGKFKLKIKLEDNWAIYSHDDLSIFFKGDIVKTKKDLRRERFIKFSEYLKKRKEQLYIEQHTRDPLYKR